MNEVTRLFIYSAFADEISPNLTEQINVLKKFNINHIEARGINGKNIAEYSVEQAKEIKKILDDNGFMLSALGSPIGKIKITDSFEPELERFKRLLDVAVVFETKYIRMFSFFMNTAFAAQYRDEVLRRWQCYVDAAKGYDIILLHENEKEIYGDTAHRCIDLIQSLKCDYVKAVFDPANFVQCGVDTIEAFDLLKDYIEYMHIKDAKYQDGVVVPSGMGDANIEEILTNLYNSDWNGFLSLEPHLGDFQGFADLEQNVVVKKESSGPEKFEVAYNALDRIVQRIVLL
ncbi:MAG: sugar phosphate isomerase/epimerase [Clostridiaceae bacterium]|nr:sugar phosphate isomerase/epimerase [Clostridiaceae bacterium]